VRRKERSKSKYFFLSLSPQFHSFAERADGAAREQGKESEIKRKKRRKNVLFYFIQEQGPASAAPSS
jgi:hypothetical protein